MYLPTWNLGVLVTAMASDRREVEAGERLLAPDFSSAFGGQLDPGSAKGARRFSRELARGHGSGSYIGHQGTGFSPSAWAAHVGFTTYV